MKITFFDMDQPASALSGKVIGDSAQLFQILERMPARLPFFCKLVSESGDYLDVGVGKIGCAQYTRAGGNPPYLMAVAPQQPQPDEDIDFLVVGTPTPIPARYCMPFAALREIIGYFQETSSPHPSFSWEGI